MNVCALFHQSIQNRNDKDIKHILFREFHQMVKKGNGHYGNHRSLYIGNGEGLNTIPSYSL